MYTPAYDRESGLLVAISNGELTPSDHTLSMEALARLDEEGVSLGCPLVTVLVVEPGAGQPTAQMRKDYAAVQAKMKAQRHLFLLVSEAAVVRGIITAVNWLRAPTERFRTEAVSTFELAVQRAERERGKPLPQLRTLLAQAEERRRGAKGQADSAVGVRAARKVQTSDTGTGRR